jgi:hypothetical protein
MAGKVSTVASGGIGGACGFITTWLISVKYPDAMGVTDASALTAAFGVIFSAAWAYIPKPGGSP